tara:strand:+ start:397 stop:591 length:195 start_codon:yes stop_codon:yes gene_type:complete
MKEILLKEASDEVVYLRKILQKYRVDTDNCELSHKENLREIDNFIRYTQIIYAKLNYFDGLEEK